MSKGKKITISWGFTPVITLVVFIITAVTAAYVGGVMSGRHLFIEEKPHGADAPVTAEPDSQEGILKPGELEFAHVLRGETRPARVKASPPPPEQPEEAKLPEPEEARPPDPPASPAPSVPQETAEIIYDFVFQMAALKDAKAADGLREQLEGAGLRTRMERNGKLYLVLVNLRGSEQRAAEITDIAKKLRLGDPLLRSKKPITP